MEVIPLPVPGEQFALVKLPAHSADFSFRYR